MHTCHHPIQTAKLMRTITHLSVALFLLSACNLDGPGDSTDPSTSNDSTGDTAASSVGSSSSQATTDEDTSGTSSPTSTAATGGVNTACDDVLLDFGDECFPGETTCTPGMLCVMWKPTRKFYCTFECILPSCDGVVDCNGNPAEAVCADDPAGYPACFPTGL